MITRLFGKNALDKALDATDAVAIALCHAHQQAAVSGKGQKSNGLTEKIAALKQEARSQNRFDEKLKQIGVDAKSRRRLTGPKGR